MSTISTPSSTAPEIDSLQSWALQYPRHERKKRLLSLIQSGTLDDEECLVAEYDWRTFWAREDQLPPDWSWGIWLALAGRGWGKTRVVGEFANEKAEQGVGPGALVARTKDDIEKDLIEGHSGILKCGKPWFRPIYTKGKVVWPNGVYALCFSAQEPDQLRGPQHAWAAADELATWPYLAEAWGNLLMGLRLGVNPQLVIATTPRPLQLLRELIADPRCHVTRGRTLDNAENLSPEFMIDIQKRYAGTRIGRQELEGEILEDVPGALWTRDMIEAARPKSGIKPPTLEMFERIGIGVDPSGSDGERGDFIGIVAAGKLKPEAAREWGKEFVVLGDFTCQERPEVWAKIVGDLFDETKADRVFAEVNYGGAMVRAVLQAAHPNLPMDMLHASRGKHVRAEPISALYEQGKVMHAIPMIELEDELGLFTPTGYKGADSPNRADALVWVLTALAFGAAAAPMIEIF